MTTATSAMVDSYWIQSYAASVSQEDKLWIAALTRAISQEPSKAGQRFFLEWYEALHEPSEKP